MYTATSPSVETKTHLSSRPAPLSCDQVAPNKSDPPFRKTPAKEKLFAWPQLRTAIINLDDALVAPRIDLLVAHRDQLATHEAVAEVKREHGEVRKGAAGDLVDAVRREDRERHEVGQPEEDELEETALYFGD